MEEIKNIYEQTIKDWFAEIPIYPCYCIASNVLEKIKPNEQKLKNKNNENACDTITVISWLYSCINYKFNLNDKSINIINSMILKLDGFVQQYRNACTNIIKKYKIFETQSDTNIECVFKLIIDLMRKYQYYIIIELENIVKSIYNLKIDSISKVEWYGFIMESPMEPYTTNNMSQEATKLITYVKYISQKIETRVNPIEKEYLDFIKMVDINEKVYMNRLGKYFVDIKSLAKSIIYLEKKKYF